MKLSHQWLKTWVDITVGAEQLAQQLTMAGLEVAAIEKAAVDFSGVKIAAIKAIMPHPNNQHCQLCTLEIGSNKELTLVCAAKNVEVGLKVAVALEGAVLPGGVKIATREIYGYSSPGMICSAAELALAESADGVLIFESSAPIGEDCFHYLQLDDSILDIELTPNRGDCLSMVGLARETGVLLQQPVSALELSACPVSHELTASIDVQAEAACPKYLARILKNVRNDVVTPSWLVERLRRAGIRTINPVVDVTNYVMIELGQPMHAFDYQKLQGDLTVRYAKADERITLLDGSDITLDRETVLISDGSRPLALAGIMGAADSGVTAATTTVQLESAFFSPLAITGKARQYGLHTDSSYRFERGVDVDLQRQALERATELLISISGAQAGPITEEISPSMLPQRETILLRRRRIEKLLGIAIADDSIVDILQRLAMNPAEHPEGWTVVAPSHRSDITLEVDLIEEIARVYGYDDIRCTKGRAMQEFVAEPESELSLSCLHNKLINLGYQEVITYSFVDEPLQKQLQPEISMLRLLNPMSQEMEVMRTSLWPGLIKTLQYNQNRQQDSLRIFESGLRFVVAEDDNLCQEQVLSALINGAAAPLSWSGAKRGVDFYDLKGDLQALFNLTHVADNFHFVAACHPALHPGQSAKIVLENKLVGYAGCLHPEISEALNIVGETYLFELLVQPLSARAVPRFKPVSKFPAVRRDIALCVDESVPAGELCEIAQANGRELLQNIQIFDLYRGDKVKKGKKSIALGLTWQHHSRTLIEDEVNDLMDKIVSELRCKLSATMRNSYMGALTKADIVERLFDDLGLNKREAKDLVELFFEEIRQALAKGKQVKLSGFGNFALRDKNQRPGRNPKTGEEIPISARRVVTFRAGQKLKSRVESYTRDDENGDGS